MNTQKLFAASMKLAVKATNLTSKGLSVTHEYTKKHVVNKDNLTKATNLAKSVGAAALQTPGILKAEWDHQTHVVSIEDEITAREKRIEAIKAKIANLSNPAE